MKRLCSGFLVLVILLSNHFQFAAGAKSASIKVNSMKMGSAFIEAESGKIKDYCKVVKDIDASGLEAVVLGNSKDKNISNPMTSSAYALEYQVEVDYAAVMNVWIRVKAENNAKIWIDAVTGSYIDCSFDSNGEYVWVKVATPYLLPGVHSIKVIPYNMGITFDELLVTRKTGTPTGTNQLDDTITMDAIGFDSTSWDIVDDGVSKKHLQNKTEWQIPDVKPLEGHPRIFFRKEDIPKILENAQKPQNISAWEVHKQYAETDEENISLEIIEAKALDYALRGNKKAGQRAVDEAMLFFEKTGRAYTLQTSGDPYNIIGQSIYTLAAVYDWCYDLLSEEQKDYIIDEMIMLGTKMEVGWPPKWQNAITTHGSEAQIQRDFFAMALAVYDERPDIYNLVASRLFNEFVPYRKWIYEGHTYNMGFMYTRYRLKWDMLCTFLADKGLGVKEIYGPDLRYVFYRQLYMYNPDGGILRDGDVQGVGFSTANPKKAERESWLAASYWKDPVLKQAYMETQNNLSFSWRNASNNTNITTTEWLLLNDPDLGGQSLRTLPLTKYFPSPTGNMTARTSWEDGIDSPAVVCDMKIEEYTLEGHDHADSGSFLLYYKGELARESGVYKVTSVGNNRTNTGSSAWGSMHHFNFARRAIAHNCMRVYDPNEKFLNLTNYIRYDEPFYLQELPNDGGQRLTNYTSGGAGVVTVEDVNNDEYKTGEVLAHEYGEDLTEPNYSYLKGDLSTAYSDKVSEYERSFMFLNLKNEDTPAALIVFDRIKSSNAQFPKIWQLYGSNYPEINGSRVVFKDQRNEQNGSFVYNGKLTVDTLMPAHENIKYNVVGGEGKWALVDGVNYFAAMPDKSSYTDIYENYRLELSPKEESELDYFLNVLQVGDADGKEAEKVTPIETDKLAGCVLYDRVVVFGKYRNRTSENVEFEFDGDGQYEFTIADMQEGTWSVYCDNEFVGNYSATSEGGLVSFTGKAGKYRLIYINTSVNKTFTQKDNSNASDYILKYNQERIYTEDAPFTVDNNIMIPIERIFRKMGAVVETDNDSRVNVSVFGQKISFENGSNKVLFSDGEIEFTKTLDTECIIKNGHMFVPLDAVAQSVGMQSIVDRFSSVINLTKPIEGNRVILSNGTEQKENKSVLYKLDELSCVTQVVATSDKDCSVRVSYSYDGEDWFVGNDVKITQDSAECITINSFCNYIKVEYSGDNAPTINLIGFEYKSDYAKIFDVAWSAQNNDNETGLQAIDDSMSTLWSSEGNYHWLQFDFYAPTDIQSAEIAWNYGDARKAYFEIVGSNDGENWTTIIKDGSSSGTTTKYEEYKFEKPVKYRYIKLLMYGNSVSKWNGVREIRFKYAK